MHLAKAAKFSDCPKWCPECENQSSKVLNVEHPQNRVIHLCKTVEEAPKP